MRHLQTTVSVLAFLVVALVWAASAEALPLHTLTAAGCISDREGVQTCGGFDGGANEAQGLFDTQGVAVSPDGTSVYAVSREDNAIVRFSRASDGTLTPAGCISDIDDAQTCGGANEVQGLSDAAAVTVSPDGTSVYLVSGNDDAIVTFNRAPDGTLTPAGCISDIDDAQTCGGADGGANEAQGLTTASAVAVSPDGASVYVAGFTEHAVVSFNRAADGSLTAAGCISDLESAQTCGGANGGPNEAQGLNGAAAIAVSPDGLSVYTAALNDDAVARFNRAPDGSLTAAGCISDVDAAQTCGGADGGPSEAQGLNSAFGIAVSPDSASVYAVSLTDDSIARFNRAPDGSLTAAGCISDVDAAQTCGGANGGANEGQGLNGALSVAVSADGASVFVASGDDDAISSFTRAPGGALTAAGCISDLDAAETCGGTNGGPNETQGLDEAFAVATDPSGVSVYIGSSSDHAVVIFKREVPPVCLGSAASGAFGEAVSVPLDCFDPNGDPLTISLVDSPADGTLGAVDQATDTVTYTPDTGFTGSDSFRFRATADAKQSQVEKATVFIQPASVVTVTPPAETPPVVTPPAATPPAKLLALLSSDKLSGRSGRKLTVDFATSAPGSATVEVAKGARALISGELDFPGDGEHKLALKLATKSSNGKAKPLKPGNYTVALTVTGADGQVATDSARLRVGKS